MLDRSEYDGIVPSYTLDSLIRYAEQGVPTGGFLEAVLANDMMGAMSRADSENRAAIGAICQFVYMEMPIGSWGSREIFHQWVRRRGLQGRDQAAS